MTSPRRPSGGTHEGLFWLGSASTLTGAYRREWPPSSTWSSKKVPVVALPWFQNIDAEGPRAFKRVGGTSRERRPWWRSRDGCSSSEPWGSDPYDVEDGEDVLRRRGRAQGSHPRVIDEGLGDLGEQGQVVVAGTGNADHELRGLAVPVDRVVVADERDRQCAGSATWPRWCRAGSRGRCPCGWTPTPRARASSRRTTVRRRLPRPAAGPPRRSPRRGCWPARRARWTKARARPRRRSRPTRPALPTRRRRPGRSARRSRRTCGLPMKLSTETWTAEGLFCLARSVRSW